MFTKLAGRRYLMTVTRERGPALAPRQGPGYDDHLPHDAVHLLVEVTAGISGGAFGRLASGQSNIFWPADPKLVRRQARREAKHHASTADEADMARSERLASICPPLWELRTGRRSHLPEWFSSVKASDLASPVVERIIERLDDFAARWSALPEGDSITLSWLPTRPTSLRGTRQHAS